VCTASWLIRPDGYDLFFNRDESRERGGARPPRSERRDGVRVIAPVDADEGGTWIGVNELGLALGLLNSWQLEDRTGGYARSRGLLVRDLLTATHADDVARGLEREDLGRYRGFRLALFQPGAEPVLFVWDGVELARTVAAEPLSSSSRDASGAQAARGEHLARLRAEEGPTPGRRRAAGVLERFHRSHVPERGALSPCMHREDARTVSASHVSVDGDAIHFRYAAGPPCAVEFGAPLELTRRTLTRPARGR
jgi:hypothetical protein